jgi:hypothetical protein
MPRKQLTLKEATALGTRITLDNRAVAEVAAARRLGDDWWLIYLSAMERGRCTVGGVFDATRHRRETAKLKRRHRDLVRLCRGTDTPVLYNLAADPTAAEAYSDGLVRSVMAMRSELVHGKGTA